MFNPLPNQKDHVEMQCRSCSVKYLRHKDTPYKTICMVCYKKQNKIKFTDTDETLIFLWDTIAKHKNSVNTQIKNKDKEIKKLKRELAIEKALSQTLRERIRSVSVQNKDSDSSFIIPKDISKKLLLLCHPDKHEGSQIAQEATQWILQKRK